MPGLRDMNALSGAANLRRGVRHQFQLRGNVTQCLVSVTAGKPCERAQCSGEVEARCQTPISSGPVNGETGPWAGL